MYELPFDYYDFLKDDPEPTHEDMEYFLQGVDIPRFNQSSDIDYTKEEFRTEEEYKPRRPTLRDYQRYGVDRIYQEWLAGKESTLLVLPTGTGKTLVIGQVVLDYGPRFGLRPDGKPRRTLILAHRDYLLTQACNELATLGVESAIEKADRRARTSLFGDPLVVVASVQSMMDNKTSKRLCDWPRDYFDLIVVDEGHHATSKVYQQIIDYFHRHHLLLVTATDERLDGINLGTVAKSKAWEYPMLDAVKAGWICPIRVKWIKLDADLSGIRTTNMGDFNASDIAEMIKPDLEPICRSICDIIEDRKTLIYCPDVQCSRIIAAAMNQLGKSTASLDGTSKNRESTIDAFKTGIYQCLSNCLLFEEGFNVPDVSCVVMLSPTNSIGRYKQRLGRGTRKKKKTDKHQDLLLVDFTWSSRKHSLIKPAHAFLCDEIGITKAHTDAAENILEGGYTTDLEAAMTRADEYLNQPKQEVKPKVKPGKVKYRSVDYDPFNIHPGEIKEHVDREMRLDRPATEAQLAVLRRNGYRDNELMGLNTSSAGVQIKIIKWRASKGYCTKKQRDELMRLGIPKAIAHTMPFRDASVEIGRLRGLRNASA